MSTKNVTVKKVAPVRIALVSGIADSNNHEDVSPVVKSLFGQLFGALEQGRVSPAGMPLAIYAPANGGRLTVTVGCRSTARWRSARYVHHGTMATIGEMADVNRSAVAGYGYDVAPKGLCLVGSQALSAPSVQVPVIADRLRRSMGSAEVRWRRSDSPRLATGGLAVRARRFSCIEIP
ncbi:hypothetical protein [Tamaricihabitans halophyticus]|nr:hypothetical protein [Tamaricihabitans halophyticus]